MRSIERWAYRLALLTYLVALVCVVFVFPGVSNLWVSIFVLVSGFFSLLAAYASAIRDQKEGQ